MHHVGNRSGDPGLWAAAARGLDTIPLRPATATPVGDSYFTSARPPECSAALLFKGSPLRPAGSSDHAESAHRVGGPALYAESVDVYNNVLNTHDVVWNGFRAVSDCHGVSVWHRSGGFRLVRTGSVTTGWPWCPGMALLLSACDSKPGFPWRL